MNITELENLLLPFSKSELYHLDNPQELSKRYDKLEKKTANHVDYYIFPFHSLLKDSNIFIMKESRFTQIPLHIHSIIELNYIYSGECTQIINEKKVHLKQGDVCILDTNTMHEIIPLGKDDIVITIGMKKSYFSSSFLSRLSFQGLLSNFLVKALSEKTGTSQFITFRNSNSNRLHLLIQQLMCEYFDKQICSTEIINSFMVIIFSELLRIYQNTHIEQVTENKLISILQYIEDNYKTLTLQSLAETFHFHPNYLSTYLRKNTGRSFKELLIIQKMTKACFYLINSSAPIAVIASDVGYENLGFFYKKFRTYYHMTPQDYRNLYQNTN